MITSPCQIIHNRLSGVVKPSDLLEYEPSIVSISESASSAEPEETIVRSSNFKIVFSSQTILLLLSIHLSAYTSPRQPVLRLYFCSTSAAITSSLQ
ncbi:hypothetical protein Leryth_024856, partial [Lithospermum erythrorhizon]